MILVGQGPKVLMGREAAHFRLGPIPTVLAGLAFGSTRPHPRARSEIEYNSLLATSTIL